MSGNFFFTLEGPLDSMPTGRQMRTANFGGFPELVRNLGVDPRWVLEQHGLNPHSIRDPDSYVDCKALVDVLEHCSRLLNDSLFGLHLAQMQEPEVFGCVTALCRSALTIRDAIESFVEYIPVIHAPMAVLELAEGEGASELRWCVRDDLGANDQASYQAIMLNLKLLRVIGGEAFRPSYVSLAVDVRAADVPEIETRLGCHFRKSSTHNAIAFPTEALNRPIASSNRLLYRLLSGYLDRVKVVSRTTIVERVEDYIRGSLPTGICSIERCARKLGTSVRTLQANLSSHDLRFCDILEKQRIELAKVYLVQGDQSLDEVAAMLGYSEQSSFGRAFKRWTGTTPQRYRRVPSPGSEDGLGPDGEWAFKPVVQ